MGDKQNDATVFNPQYQGNIKIYTHHHVHAYSQ